MADVTKCVVCNGTGLTTHYPEQSSAQPIPFKIICWKCGGSGEKDHVDKLDVIYSYNSSTFYKPIGSGLVKKYCYKRTIWKNIDDGSQGYVLEYVGIEQVASNLTNMVKI